MLAVLSRSFTPALSRSFSKGMVFASKGHKGLVFRFFQNNLVFTPIKGKFDTKSQVVVVLEPFDYERFRIMTERSGLKSGESLLKLLYKGNLSVIWESIKRSSELH
jgi:hypothetical protein